MTGSGTQRSYLEFPVRVDSSRLPSVRPMAGIGAERKLILGIGCVRFLCRVSDTGPINDLSAGAEGPVSESLQGRNPRGLGEQRAVYGYLPGLRLAWGLRLSR